MENENHSYKLKSRSLGDEWNEWNGTIEVNDVDLETSSSLFLYLLALTVLLLLAGLWLIYYFISPIFSVTFPFIDFINFWIAISITLISIIYYMLLVLTQSLKKPIAFFMKDKQLADSFIARITLFLGVKINIPQDRIINSMLKVGNILTKTLYSSIKREELLVILPRCLAKNNRVELNQLAKKFGLTLHVASGGTQARSILKETKPKGIIAVACERDLYAGVKDVPPQIPVIALANKRPEGPCRNTLVNEEELKMAIEFFLGKEYI